MTPSAATLTPITEPPLNAIDSALAMPPSFAPWQALTLLLVAASIPRSPASIEQIAPARNARAV